MFPTGWRTVLDRPKPMSPGGEEAAFAGQGWEVVVKVASDRKDVGWEQ